MLRIAVPNKGSLADSWISILKVAGYRQISDSRDLVLIDPENNVEFYYLRPRDIAIYVGTGELEAGITGRDLLIDSGATSEEILSLDFGRSTFRFAAPVGKNLKLTDISGKRVATAYPGLVEDFLSKHALTASVVRLDGAVESSVRLGVADLIADVVSTGNTLKNLSTSCRNRIASLNKLHILTLQHRVLVAKSSCCDNLTSLHSCRISWLNNHFLIENVIVFFLELQLVDRKSVV
jgi:ATP phosphoribosyltransferase